MAEDNLKPLIEKLQESVDAQGAQLTRVEDSVDVLAKHLKPLPGKVDGLSKELKAFRAETDANFVEVNDQLGTREATDRRHEDRLTKVESRVTDLEKTA